MVLRKETKKEAELTAEEKDILIKSKEDDHVTDKITEGKLETFLKNKLNHGVKEELKNLKELKKLHQVEHDKLNKKIEAVEHELDDQITACDNIILSEEELITGDKLEKADVDKMMYTRGDIEKQLNEMNEKANLIDDLQIDRAVLESRNDEFKVQERILMEKEQTSDVVSQLKHIIDVKAKKQERTR